MIGTLPLGQRLLVEHAARAAPMVGMGVGEDDSGHRPLAAMLEIQRHRRARAFDRGQRIDHDHAGVALDQRHVGDVEAAHLIDAGHDFEQSMIHVEARLPPQAGIDRRRRFRFGQKAVGLEAPDHPALRGGDPRMVQRAEKAARGFVEIARIGKRQRLQRRRMLRDHWCRGVLRCFAGARLGHVALSLSPAELGAARKAVIAERSEADRSFLRRQWQGTAPSRTAPRQRRRRERSGRPRSTSLLHLARVHLDRRDRAAWSRTRFPPRTAFPCRDRSAPARSPSSSARRRSSPAPWSW